MRILHIIPAFYPAYSYGGPIESVYRLCVHLARLGHDVRVLTTDANGLNQVLDVDTDRELELTKGLHVSYCHRWIRHSASPVLLKRLLSYLHWADVVHLTAVYSFPTLPALAASTVLNKPVVWSPRGALQHWGESTRGRTKAFWEWVCRAIRPGRLILHATSEGEAKESRERLKGVETAVIPNGVEIPQRITRKGKNGALSLLYLGRLHPIKGIEALLDACRLLSLSSSMDWSLAIAGAGDPDYTRRIRGRIEEMRLSGQVRMVGEATGEVKEKLFEDADIIVVPSFKESFGMVVVEALAHGVPVIASRGTPWDRLEENACGRWVQNDPENLAESIRQMSRMPLREMGQRGWVWVEREFSWERKAQEMVSCYQRIMGENTHAM